MDYIKVAGKQRQNGAFLLGVFASCVRKAKSPVWYAEASCI